MLRAFVGFLKSPNLFYGITVAAVLFILSSRTVSEAILDFCLGGVVPGTDRVLPPDVMIIGVVVGLGLMAVIILLAWLRHIVSIRRLAEAASSEAAATPQSGIKRTATKSKHIFVVGANVYNPFHHQLLPVWLEDFVRAPSTQVFEHACMQVVRRGLRAIFLAAVLLVIVLDKITELPIACGKSAWQWLKPHAILLDTWLELRYLAYCSWFKRSMLQLEPVQVLYVVIREGTAQLRRLFK